MTLRLVFFTVIALFGLTCFGQDDELVFQVKSKPSIIVFYEVKEGNDTLVNKRGFCIKKDSTAQYGFYLPSSMSTDTTKDDIVCSFRHDTIIATRYYSGQSFNFGICSITPGKKIKGYLSFIIGKHSNYQSITCTDTNVIVKIAGTERVCYLFKSIHVFNVPRMGRFKYKCDLYLDKKSLLLVKETLSEQSVMRGKRMVSNEIIEAIDWLE